MNLLLNNFLLLVINVLLSSALYEDNLGLNPYIIKYDKTNYDHKHLRDRHSRVKRSLDKHIFFTFKSHGRDFKLKLSPAAKHSYASNLVETNGNQKPVDLHDYVNFYEGVLLDEPSSSYVSGSIIDGLFFGTIKSAKYGKYYIESSKRYNHSLDSHTIIYHEKDVNYNNTRVKMSKRSASLDDENEASTCGSAKKSVKEWMRKEQEEMYKERVRLEGYDPFSYLDKEKYNLDENYNFVNKYSREANEHGSHANRKRDTSGVNEPRREEFPQKRTICNLYLRVDPHLHSEIFNNEGNRDNDKTTTFLLFYLNKHVEALNTIYNSLPFYDSNKEKYYIGLQFMIYRTKIITEEQCKNRTILSPEELKLCEPYLDVSTFLNYVSLDNFTDYCLSYTFTARDFTDGTLGLAWVAKLAGSVGGVCERRQILQGVAKSLNSGIVTVVNYQARVPEAVSQITFAHEVGHNFGSEHDPDDSTCSPGTTKGGNFIMYRRATTGTDRNNRNFSQCSRDQMGPIIHALVENKNKFCFKQFSGSLCGNGIVEEGEECDCGYGTDCKESCCIDASQDTNKCKLKPNKQCSPSQGPCCDNSCSFASSKTICMQSNECLNNVTCTGKNATCPRFDNRFFKPDKTECNSGTQVCRSGICSGSICEKYEMKQCFLEGNLKDKKQDKAVLCHLACTGEKTSDKCVDSFLIPEMVNPNTSKGLILKPGSPCIGTLGYCDIFSKCRSVDGEGPLARLKNFLLNPVTLSSIRDWITTYWWAASLITIGLVVFMATFIKVCSVHTPSSNPRKPPALKITETLRRPMKRNSFNLIESSSSANSSFIISDNEIKRVSVKAADSNHSNKWQHNLRRAVQHNNASNNRKQRQQSCVNNLRATTKLKKLELNYGRRDKQRLMPQLRKIKLITSNVLNLKSSSVDVKSDFIEKKKILIDEHEPLNVKSLADEIPHPHLHLHLGHSNHNTNNNANQSKPSSSKSQTQSTSLSQPPAKSSRSQPHTHHSSHLINEKFTKVAKPRGASASSEHQIHKKHGRRSAQHQAHSAKGQPISTNDVHLKEKTKVKSSGLFSRRHKSSDQYHYYSTNHPLHPIPHHKASSSQAAHLNNSNRKHHSSSSSSSHHHHHHDGRSRSVDESSSRHNRVVTSGSSSSNGNNRNEKKTSRKSSVDMNPSYSSKHTKVTSHLKPEKSKVKKRTSTESSSIES